VRVAFPATCFSPLFVALAPPRTKSPAPRFNAPRLPPAKIHHDSIKARSCSRIFGPLGVDSVLTRPPSSTSIGHELAEKDSSFFSIRRGEQRKTVKKILESTSLRKQIVMMETPISAAMIRPRSSIYVMSRPRDGTYRRNWRGAGGDNPSQTLARRRLRIRDADDSDTK